VGDFQVATGGGFWVAVRVFNTFQMKGELTMSVENIRKSIDGRISFLMTNPEDQFNTDSSA
jgi:hypothetical protein